MVGAYIRGFGELTLKGLVALNAPNIAKGMLIELLHRYKVDVPKAIELVTENKSLWSLFPPEHYDKLQRVISQVSDVSWLTVEWVIDAAKKDHKALASLFLSWRKGRNWLQRQLEEIKKQVDSNRNYGGNRGIS